MTDRRQLLTTVLFLLTFVAGSQNRIRTVTEIRTEYKTNGQVKTDTLKSEFDFNGSRVNDNVKTKTIYSVKSTTIDSAFSLVHKRIFFSDSTFQDKYVFYYKDSISVFCLDKSDTLYRETEIYRGHKVSKRVFQAYDETHKPYFQKIVFRTKGYQEIETRFCKDCSAELSKVKTNRLTRTRKEYAYNPDKDEWYRKLKEKFDSDGRVKMSKEKLYHDFHKTYFSSKTKFRYDEYGNVTSKKQYDHFFVLTEQSRFTYTYY